MLNMLRAILHSGTFKKKPESDTWHYTEFGKKFVEKYEGGRFEFVAYKRGRYQIRCNQCGGIEERARSTIQYKTVDCKTCEQKKKEQEELQLRRAELTRLFYALKESKTPKICPVCGNTFYSQYSTKVYCDDKCKRKKKIRAHKRKTRSLSKYRQRCQKYGVYYDPSVTREKVIRRDNGTCQICGIKCNPDDKSWGSFGATYPTLDHIIPLAKGGTHTWDNVQCACAMCNSLKRDIV